MRAPELCKSCLESGFRSFQCVKIVIRVVIRSERRSHDVHDMETGSVRYLPWPDDGCTLAEARKRCADRELWDEWCARADAFEGIPDADLKAKVEASEQRINVAFLENLRRGRLIATGRADSPTAEPAVIDAGQWSTLVDINWSTSAAADARPGAASFHDVRILPAVHAPTIAHLLDGLTMVEAARRYVLEDPEVVALGRRAVAIEPVLDRVFKLGYWSAYGERRWPLYTDDLPRDRDEDDFPLEKSMFRCAKPASSHLYVARRAFQERLGGLLKPLRDGSLIAEGLPFRGNDPTRVPRSIWSHGEFWLDLEKGDVFEENPESRETYDGYLKRWSGLMTCRHNERLELGERAAAIPFSNASDSTQVAPKTMRARRQPKSDSVKAALQTAGIDLATDPRGPTELAGEIADRVPWRVAEANELEALAKNVSRLKRRLG